MSFFHLNHRRPIIFLFWLLLLGVSDLFGHDFFLRPESYQSLVGDTVEIRAFEGSFEKSVNSISAPMIIEIKKLGPTGQSIIEKNTWKQVKWGSKFWKVRQEVVGALGGINLRHTSSFHLDGLEEGTHTIAATLKETRVAFEKESFLEYLETEAFSDIASSDVSSKAQDNFVRERFIKIAKTIIQSGANSSDQCVNPLGLDAEIVPVIPPSEIQPGDAIDFLILLNGIPLQNQSVVAARRRGPFRKSRDSQIVLHSNEEGIVTVPITHSGEWWLQFIYLIPAPDEDEMDYVSRWASLTFEIK